MILMQGKGVSQGVAKGPLYFFQRPDTRAMKGPAEDLEAEKTRLAEDRKKAMAQLEVLAEKCWSEAGHESAMVFETHAMHIGIDATFHNAHQVVQKPLGYVPDICRPGLHVGILHGSELLTGGPNGILRAVPLPSQGIQDTCHIILVLHKHGIPAADDLTPSEAIRLDKSKILGFVTMGGSGNSHTAILARTLGIPAICGLGDSLKEA